MYKFNKFVYFGDWGLGIGDWGLGPIPNPQSPIPKFNTYKTYYLNNNNSNYNTIIKL